MEYVRTIVGFLVKIFPIIILPFLILWNSKGGDFKKEIAAAGVMVFITLPIIIWTGGTFSGRLGSSGQVYANTPAYLLHMHILNIFHVMVKPETISWVLYGLAGIAFIWLTIAFLRARKSPVMLLTTLLAAIFIIVFVSRLHSPQYLMWYLPFLCLLVSGDIYLTIGLLMIDVIAYLEFPILFGRVYTNAEYLSPAGSGLWYATIFFFSMEFLVMLLLVLAIIYKNRSYFEPNGIIVAGKP